ncbi:hypothetical protein TrLO_g15808 [Triparma laevis f. longispina]|uniref:Uncharacterized protein n=1 Tax=Triparma laevis f. longispina TaxID=1714387 RepID=A0A9W7DZ18_9STRA|nr:hypothetical protein TrLO_g15808 [Triparma laevis f. longispina]
MLLNSAVPLLLLLLPTLSSAFKSLPSKTFIQRVPVRSKTSLSYDSEGSSNFDLGSLTALTSTETWLTSAIPEGHLRKEVSYSLESTTSPCTLISHLFTRITSQTKLGSSHSTNYPSTSIPPYRSTMMVVCPNVFEEFEEFNRVVKTVMEVRRNGRSFNTMGVVEGMREMVAKELGEEDDEWQTSVNLAHLHPNFRNEDTPPPTPESPYEDLSDEERQYQEKIKLHKLKKTLARQSPYPTVVVEVRSQKVNSGVDDTLKAANAEQKNPSNDSPPSLDSLKFLEASFSKSAAGSTPPTPPSITPDIFPQISPKLSAKTYLTLPSAIYREFNGKGVEEAYSFIFEGLGHYFEGVGGVGHIVVVMPKFLRGSATSFQKFGNDVNKLCEAIKLPIHATVYHPEDVDEDKRCPVGCLVMEVGAVQTNM